MTFYLSNVQVEDTGSIRFIFFSSIFDGNGRKNLRSLGALLVRRPLFAARDVSTQRTAAMLKFHHIPKWTEPSMKERKVFS